MNFTSRKVYSLILFALLGFSIFLSLPFLNFNREIPSVYADTTTSGFNFFTNAIDLAIVVGDNTWKEQDVSAHIPAGSTGVILEINSQVGFNSIDIRKKGSTDEWYKQSLIANNHKYVYVGVDEDRIFEIKHLGNNDKVYLQGYTDSSVVFFDNIKDYQIVPTGSWETIDVSADVPSGATGTIWKILGQNNQIKEVGVRHPDSTDDYHEDIRQWCYLLTGVNSAREIEAYIETTDMDHYLVGYTTSPITFLTNWIDISMVDVGSWEEIDVTAETSASANGVIVYMRKLNWDADDMNIRAKGSTDDRSTFGIVYMDGQEFASIELDASQVFEGWIDAVECDFYVVGYTELGIVYPVNEDVVSNPEFAQNSTIGWINVSVSHTAGYGNISDVVTTINTTGGELANLTWWNTPEGDIFEITYDPLSMIVLLDDTFSFTTGTDIWNISWNVAFRRGTTGFCDVNVTTTAIDDYYAETEYADEFYLSDFLRATGLQWSKFLGGFDDTGTDSVAMDDNGDYVAVGTHETQNIFIYDSDGELQRTFDVHPGGNNFTSDFYVEMSGDGNYVMFTVRKTTTIWNFTVFERATGVITYTEQMTGGLDPVGLFISSNYNASLIAVTNFPNMIKLYNYAGYLWNATTMNGIALPTIQWVSTSRTGDVIASGTTGDGLHWDNASVFRWNSSSSEPMWVWNSSVATSGVHDVEVSDTGEYICAIVSSTGYASDIIIFDSSSSSPLHEEQLPHIRTWGAKYSMDFVAEPSRTDEFYIVTTGDWDLNDNIVFCCKYNLTSDTFTTIWTYYEESVEFGNIQLSNILHNERYYLCLNGEGGVYYWDTTSNETIWTYWNATKDYWYASRMNRDGNRFFIDASILTGSSDNYVDYFGYEGELPFFVGSANITNMEGCGNWIFSDERFYQVEGNFTHVIDPTMLDHVGLRFTDGYNTFYLWYNVSARSDPNIDSFDLIVSPQWDADKSPGAIDTTTSSATIDDAELTVVWKFWPTLFSFDAMDVDIYAFMNDTLGNTITWALEETDLFHLYVLGGFTNSTSIGDAGQYQGRSPFDVYAGDDSSVLVETYYRKLEQVHLKYKIWIPDGFIDFDQNWTLDLGMDFCFYGDDTWYKGWKTQVQTFGGSEIATGNNKWINYTVEHYRYNPTGEDYEPMKQGKMYAFWEGFESGRDFFQLYTDLWFSSGNRSRMWGARVNSVYFGMKNEALFGMGWLFGNNWRTMIGNFTDISYKDNIMDYSGTSWGVQRYTTEIVMCRFWLNLSRPDTEFPFYVRVQDYSSLDFNRLQSGQFEGIDDPVLIETSTPYMGEPGGLLGNFFGWLMEQASFIVEGLTIGIMSGIGVFVSFLDILFGIAGWEGGASAIMGWITSFITWIIDGFNYLIDLMVSLFSVMATWLVLGIQRFVGLGSGLVVIYTNLVWIYAQANAGWIDVSEIINPLLPLIPLAFFIWLLNSRDVEHIFQKITMCWNFLRTLLGFFIQIGQYTLQLISSIVEAIQW